jgi:biopolymer transport protein ExbD
MKKGFLKHGEFEQDFELNIASIIDCFVVLIAFILVSTSFFSIGVIDAQVAGASEDAANVADSVPVTIELKADHSIVLRSGTNGQTSTRIATRDLAASLESLKSNNPELKSAIVIADNSVSYRDVMASMEVAKGKIAQVNLGGF